MNKTNEDILTFHQSVNARVVDIFQKLEELETEIQEKYDQNSPMLLIL